MDKWEKQHNINIARYQYQIQKIYEQAAKEAALIGKSIDGLGDELLDITKFPVANEKMKKLIAAMYKDTNAAIVNGIRSEWTLANEKNNELCNMVFGDNVKKLSHEQYKRYFSTNIVARDAFIARREGGMNLSDRVWKYTNEYKKEIELGLDVGIRAGLSADEMSRELRSYLQHPDKLFRRVRDEHGQLKLSKAASEFHPGQGVYRSSYMNARRLAATETNIAFRTADYERYQQLDFVVGIEVNLSNNHNCKGIPAGQYFDICDELKGKYPKDFKFTGWHPHCRCYVTTILKTEEEMKADNDRIMRGEDVSSISEKSVSDVPESFKQWQKNNEDRAKHQNNIPFFIKDNLNYVSPELMKAYGKLAIPIKWKDEFAAVRGNVSVEDIKLITGIAQGINHNALEKYLGIKKGPPMTIDQANGGKVNPHFGEGEGYSINCQTCTLVYELRRRGFNVEAMENRNGEVWKIVKGTEEIFKTPFGNNAEYKSMVDALIEDRFKLDLNHKQSCLNFIAAMTKDEGRYELSLLWDNNKDGHVICIERINELLIWYDPQTGQKGDRLFLNDETDYLDNIKKYCISIRRIDDKLVNRKMFSRLVKKI